MGTHRCEQGLPYQRKEEPDEVRVDPRLRRRRSAGAEAWRAVEKLEREGGRSAGRQEEKEQHQQRQRRSNAGLQDQVSTAVIPFSFRLLITARPR